MDKDPLYAAATRPAEILGVHWGATFANVVLWFYAGMLAQNLILGMAVIPAHLVLAILSSKDPYIFRVAY